MNYFQEWLKSEEDPAVIDSLLACCGKKAAANQARIDKARADIERWEADQAALAPKLQVLKYRSDALHDKKLKPVKKAIERMQPDHDLGDTMEEAGSR